MPRRPPAGGMGSPTFCAEWGGRDGFLRPSGENQKGGTSAVMRRADDRRSASVMISSSIRWSLAGNDVDWMMKASEPRTFSWIATKISMSAKRRTTALVSGRPNPCAISCASAGLELPATSLIEPFLADIDASPRALLDTTFSISSPYRTGGFRWARRYQAGGAAGNPLPRFSRQNCQLKRVFGALLGAVGEGTVARSRACHGWAAAAWGGSGRRHVGGGAIDHSAGPAQGPPPGLSPNHILRRGPGGPSRLA